MHSKLNQSIDKDRTELSLLAHLDHEDEELEIIDNKKASSQPFWIEMMVILTTLFLAESSRGMVVPTLALYIQSLNGGASMLGVTVSVYSVGRLFGSTILGVMYNRFGPRYTLSLALVLSVIGNIMYSFGAISNIWIVLLSRLLTGFSTGTLTIARAFIAERTPQEKRTQFISYSNAVQYVGFAVTPGIAGILALMDFHIGTLPINAYTLPGWILAILNGLMIFPTLFLLPVTSAATEQGKDQKKEESSVSGVKSNELRMFYIGLALFITLNLVARGVLSILETISAETFMSIWSHYDKDEDLLIDTSRMLFAQGLVGFVIFFLIDYMTRCIPEHHLLAASFGIISAGSVLLIDFSGTGLSLVRYLIGTTLVLSLGSPIVQTIIISSFSKILGSKPQGTLMGYIGSAGSIGRIIFPVLVGITSKNIGFILSVALSVACTVGVLVYTFFVKRIKYRQLVESLIN